VHYRCSEGLIKNLNNLDKVFLVFSHLVVATHFKKHEKMYSLKKLFEIYLELYLYLG